MPKYDDFDLDVQVKQRGIIGPGDCITSVAVYSVDYKCISKECTVTCTKVVVRNICQD